MIISILFHIVRPKCWRGSGERLLYYKISQFLFYKIFQEQKCILKINSSATAKPCNAVIIWKYHNVSKIQNQKNNYHENVTTINKGTIFIRKVDWLSNTKKCSFQCLIIVKPTYKEGRICVARSMHTLYRVITKKAVIQLKTNMTTERT